MNTSKMDKFQEKLQKVLVPIADKLSNQRHLAAVRDAMGILIPLTIIGGFAILLAQPPVDPETLKATNLFTSLKLPIYLHHFYLVGIIGLRLTLNTY